MATTGWCLVAKLKYKSQLATWRPLISDPVNIQIGSGFGSRGRSVSVSLLDPTVGGVRMDNRVVRVPQL